MQQERGRWCSGHRNRVGVKAVPRSGVRAGNLVVFALPFTGARFLLDYTVIAVPQLRFSWCIARVVETVAGLPRQPGTRARSSPVASQAALSNHAHGFRAAED